jgi:serine/threonine-protein kinase
MYCPKCGTQNDDRARFCRSCGEDVSGTPSGDTTAPRAEPGEVSELELVRGELRSEYDIIEELGRGGMAIVFRASERQLEREVAIKVLPFSLAFDKEFVERFQREARTAAKLEHPNIIPIYRVGRSGPVIYFVMKFLRGKPLSSQLAARGSLPPSDIRRILGEVGRALAYAHRSGIVHRDIKPDNIMFDEHGQAVVTDFGIAKAGSGGKLTGTGMAIGTPHYMSPEQARAQNLDGRSDLYSLGVVAYQCLAGVVPFDGEDSFSIGYKHIMEEVPVPRLETPEKRELFEIIRCLMAKRPDDRFQDADALVAALDGQAPVPSIGLSAASTRAIPSLSQRGIATAATTPLPGLPGTRTGAPPATPAPARATHHRSVLGGVFLWVVIVGAVFGGGGYFAYAKGLLDPLLANDRDPSVVSDTVAIEHPAGADTALVDTGASADSGRTPVPPGTPGRLIVRGVPPGARLAINGQPVRGTELDLPPGTHLLVVSASGHQPFQQQVVITPGNPSTVSLQLEREGAGGRTIGPCEQYGPEYNRENICWDKRPTPLTPTFVPVASDAPIFPRPAILLIHVSPNGATLDARIFGPSNAETFNTQALDMARALRWNPATKNGEPTEAWIQWQFVPQRQ